MAGSGTKRGEPVESCLMSPNLAVLTEPGQTYRGRLSIAKEFRIGSCEIWRYISSPFRIFSLITT